MNTEQTIKSEEEKLLVKLQDIYSRKLLIPVVGSGLSIPLQMPDWKTLILEAAKHFGLADGVKKQMELLLEKYEFLDAIDMMIEQGIAEEELQNFIAVYIDRIKRKAPPNQENNYYDLAKMKQIRFLTTNYDEYLNDIVGVRSFPLQRLSQISVNEFGLREYDDLVIPLHGEISHPDSIVFSRKSYEKLYGTEQFEREFQHLRTHFTFLFMGFSFEDLYFQKMFEKVLNRFEATHYILFSDRVRKEQPKKINFLRQKYGVEVIFYHASSEGHVKPISRLLHQVCGLVDPDIDCSELIKLPEKPERAMSIEEAEIIERGRKAIEGERLTEVCEVYSGEYHGENFRKHSMAFQVEIICGLLWYNGFVRRNDLNELLYEREMRNPEMKEMQSKFTFMFAQSLWNMRQYERCLELLEEYEGEEQEFMAFFKDTVKCFQKFLPESSDVSGELSVYGECDRTEEEKMEYRTAYAAYKKKYVNEETYNLLNLRQYKNKEIQQTIYYYLGVTAGQLFHEHREAIQYLNRAYELTPLMSVCEELAHNYLELGHNAVRYRENGKTHELDIDSLLKAKIRFQYLMNFEDETARHDFYKRSGYAYLRTLFWLRDYREFEKFYQEAAADIPEAYDLFFMKAQVDVQSGRSADAELLKKLNEQDRIYMEFLQMQVEAGHVSPANREQQMKAWERILVRADELGHPMNDRRVVTLLFDAIIFSKSILYYEKMKEIYPEEVWRDLEELGFADELYGRVLEAQTKFEQAFETYQDYQGTFQILRGFYIRQGNRNAYEKLYSRVIATPPNEMFQTAEFFGEYIVSVLRDWSDVREALVLYQTYYSRIQKNRLCWKELEEMLKIHVADYQDYEDRIAWNRYVLEKAPEEAKPEIYISILKLYAANCQFYRAKDVLEEMRRLKIPVRYNFDKLIAVCIRSQKRSYYVGGAMPFTSDREVLKKIADKMCYHGRFHKRYFDAFGLEILLSMEQCLCMFYENRQNELKSFSRIYIMYADVVRLQNSLWAREDPFLRMVLQWITSGENVVLAAPEFLGICERMSVQQSTSMESLQRQLFVKEHPDVIRI